MKTLAKKRQRYVVLVRVFVFPKSQIKPGICIACPTLLCPLQSHLFSLYPAPQFVKVVPGLKKTMLKKAFSLCPVMCARTKQVSSAPSEGFGNEKTFLPLFSPWSNVPPARSTLTTRGPRWASLFIR